jgi:hypothetical protein
MDEAQVGVTSVFVAVVVHGLFDLGGEGSFGVIIEPEHAGVHDISSFQT